MNNTIIAIGINTKYNTPIQKLLNVSFSSLFETLAKNFLTNINNNIAIIAEKRPINFGQ